MSISRSTVDAFEALKQGQDIDTVMNQLEGAQPETAVVEQEEAVEPQVDEIEETTIQSSTQEEGADEDVEETVSEDQTPESESESDGAAASEVEEIRVNGKRVKIDYTDKEKTKKAYRMAGLARKMQTERDSATAELNELKPKYEESAKFEQAIEESYSAGGIPGLIDLVTEGKFSEWFKGEYERERKKEDASPAELERIEAAERAEATARELERLKREREEEAEARKKESAQNEQQRLQNLMTPAFNKWRFSGKIKDAQLAADVDSMIWTRAVAAINDIPESVQLTSAMVEREFRKASNALRRLTQSEANDTVTRTLDTKKKEAQQKVAIAAAKAPDTQAKDDEVRSLIKKGDLRSALKRFIS